MPISWCGGSKSVRTSSTNLDTPSRPLPSGKAAAEPQNGDRQSNGCGKGRQPTLVKIKSVLRSPSLLANGQSTPTTVLAAEGAPDPLREHEKYDKVADIGIGASGFVILAEESVTKQQVAIKFLDRGSTAVKSAGKEILNQRLCCMHPNIVQLHEVFLTPEYLAIVSEFAPGGDLVDYIERHNAAYDRALMEAEARWLFQQLIVAVDYCHQMGIANRDIKLENTLLTDASERPRLKLCDFGYSKDELCASISKTMCGTPEYVAPEVLLYNKYAGKMADVWSCGILLYCMLTGCFPFRRKEDEGLEVQAVLQRMLPRILKAEYQQPKGLTPECLDLLSRLLQVDADKRITIPQILQHPWFVQDLAEDLADLNTSLLQIPLSMQTGSCRQSEEEVAAIAAKAAQSHKPRMSSSFGSNSFEAKNLYY